jgi:hypothetical protein
MTDSAGSGSPPISSLADFLAALLGDRERFFQQVVEGEDLARKLRYAVVTLLGLSALYGGVAGAYSGPLQALASAVKLPLLFVTTFVVCFPAFFVVQVLLGSRLGLLQLAVLVASALSLTTVLLAAFIPIPAFFLLTGANYYFQHLLHIAIVLVCGLFGMYALHDGLAVVCEQRGVYPRRALTILRIWAVIFGFVGIQTAWNLRPFLGDRNQPFQFLGRYEGNFYTAVIYAVKQLVHEDTASANRPRTAAHSGAVDQLLGQPDSSTGVPPR